MATGLARAKLARAACALNARAHVLLPPLILMTDENRLADPVSAAAALPKGSAVILRHTDASARAELAQALASLSARRGLIFLVASDAELAMRVGADGLHLPEKRLSEAAHYKALRPRWLVTAAAHSGRALALAGLFRADAGLLGPAFPTLSHKERAPLGIAKFRLIAANAPLPVYALGGVNAQSVVRLAGARLAGIAAIEGLLAG
jgi:thiamine-phosphate pyrophosphorylase